MVIFGWQHISQASGWSLELSLLDSKAGWPAGCQIGRPTGRLAGLLLLELLLLLLLLESSALVELSELLSELLAADTATLREDLRFLAADTATLREDLRWMNDGPWCFVMKLLPP